MKHEQWTHVICHSTHIRIQSFFIAGCGHFESFAECLVRVNNIRCVNADKRRPHEHIIKPQLSYWISTRSTWRIVVNEIRTDPDTTYAESWCNSIDIIVHVLIECKLRWNAMHGSGRPFFLFCRCFFCIEIVTKRLISLFLVSASKISSNISLDTSCSCCCNWTVWNSFRFGFASKWLGNDAMKKRMDQISPTWKRGNLVMHDNGALESVQWLECGESISFHKRESKCNVIAVQASVQLNQLKR